MAVCKESYRKAEDGESECWQRLWKGESCRRKRESGRGWKERTQKDAGCGKTAKANAGKDRGKAKAAAGSAKAAVCDGGCHGLPCSRGLRKTNIAEGGRARTTAKGRTLAEANECDEGSHKEPCARRLRDATVAESDRVRKAANEASAVCERLKGLKEVNTGKETACDKSRFAKRLREDESYDGPLCAGGLRRASASQGGRVWEYGQALPKVTVWKETAKAKAANSVVCGKTAKEHGAQQRS